MGRESIRVTRSVTLDPGEIELRVSRSSGPGGQHANTAATRVEAVFDVEASASLSPAQKRRVVARAGPVIRAVAQDERSQTRNREPRGRAARGEARRRATGRAPPAPHPSDGGVARAAPRGQAPPRRGEARAWPPGRRVRGAG